MSAPIYAPPAQPLLVSETTAIAKLRLGTPLDSQLQTELDLAIAAASQYIREYLKSANDPAWDATSCPPLVQAAVLVYLENLWVYGLTSSEDTEKAAGMQIDRLLKTVRDPAVA